MSRHLSTKFFAVDDRSGGVLTPAKEYNSSNDILDELGEPGDDDGDSKILETDDNEDKPDKSDKQDKEDKKGKKDEKDEDDEDEIELEDDDKDKDEIELEEGRIDVPPRWKVLIKEYPGIDKKYPYLSKMFSRDRQYNEMFGSFDDAREAHQKAETLDEFESSLMSGNSETLFARIKENDPKAFTKIADKILPTIHKIDKDAYYNIVSDVVNRVIGRMSTEGKRLNNEQLQDAAVLVNQFVFGRSEYEPRRSSAEDDETPQGKDLERREAEFEQRQLTAAISDVSRKVSNTLKNTITAHIDPRNEMTAFEKKHAINQAIEYIDNSINTDRAFRGQLDRLWKNSLNEKLSDSSKDRIRVTILGKAKTLLKTAITKARSEALKGNTRRSSESDSDRESNDRRAPIRRGIDSTPQNRGKGGKNTMQKGESVLDFLSRD